MEFRYLAAVLVATLIASAAASAHHGYDDFYKDRRVTVEGVLEDIVYANPHVTMKIRTDGWRPLYRVVGGDKRRPTPRGNADDVQGRRSRQSRRVSAS